MRLIIAGKKVLHTAGRLSYFFVRLGGRMFIGGIVISVAAGMVAMYFFAYRVTKKSYQAEVQFTEVNVSSLNKILERLDAQQNAPAATLSPRDPFQ